MLGALRGSDRVDIRELDDVRLFDARTSFGIRLRTVVGLFEAG
jgi:hypothetical protein